MAEKLLEVKNLRTEFKRDKTWVTAVNNVSFSIQPGEILGLVGESGCGKSVTSLSIMKLLARNSKISNGEILLNGKDLLKEDKKGMRKIRGREVAMIFQEPMTALNPVFRIGDQVDEVLALHNEKGHDEAQIKARTIELLEMVGIANSEGVYAMYPHELSGGMRQRVMIAIALCCKPDLLIADEPTTALDVTVQAQIMDLIQQLKEEENMGVILITHDMAVVAENCDRVIVMYLGQMVEEASVTDIFEHPLHPYTVGLIQSIPQMTTDSEQELFMIKGSLPLLTQIKKGCRFASRCPYATDKCREEEPELQKTGENHSVRCHFSRFGE